MSYISNPIIPSILLVRTLLAAFIYSLTESCFTYCESGYAFTSWAQFYCNLLYVPILLDLYGKLFSSLPWLYVLCFPLNIYILEIIVGHFLIWLHGYNVAWCYRDYTDSYANGCFRLAHAPFWLGLGFCTHSLWPIVTTWSNTF